MRLLTVGIALSILTGLSLHSAANGAAPARSAFLSEQVAYLSNVERAKHGLSPLKLNQSLSAAAAWLARDMAQKGYFDHTDRQGRGLRDRLELFRYLDWRGVAENIAAGLHTPSGAVTSWMNSPEHRANLLNPNFSEIGAGYHVWARSEWKRYWVQNFGARLGYYPVIINQESPRTASSEVTIFLHGEGWARSMRFSNDRSAWTAWEDFTPTRKWQLAPGSGSRTVYAQLRGESNTFSSYDSIQVVQTEK